MLEVIRGWQMRGLPLRRRFDPRPVHLGPAVDKVRWHWDEFFLGFFCLLSLHECSILIFHLTQSVCDLSNPFEKLTVPEPVKQFPSFCAILRFINVFTWARHLSLILRQVSPVDVSHPISWMSILVLSYHLRLGISGGSFPVVSHQNANPTTC